MAFFIFLPVNNILPIIKGVNNLSYYVFVNIISIMKIPGLDNIINEILLKKSCRVGGVWGSAYAFIFSQIAESLSKANKFPASLLITNTIEEAEAAMEDLDTFIGNFGIKLEYFPFNEGIDTEANPDIAAAKMKVLGLFANTPEIRNTIIVGPMQALAQKVPALSSFKSNFIKLKTGDTLNLEKLSALLTEQGFIRRNEVNTPGEFSVRGGIIDIFTLSPSEPIRIELIGDSIESLRTFTPSEQISQNTISEITLSFNLLDKKESYLTDYLPAETIIINSKEMGDGNGEEIIQKLKGFQHLNFFTLPVKTGEKDYFGINFQITSLERFSGNLTGLTNELNELRNKGLTLSIFCPHKSEINRLNELISSEGKIIKSGISLKIGRLNSGFIFTDISRAFISYNELFNRYRQPRYFRTSTGDKNASGLLDPFFELEKGDFVVHVKYGIGKFKGIERLDKEGVSQEYMVLEYKSSGGSDQADRASVYVPMHQSNLVEKYIGGADRKPELSKLGTDLWEMKKERVKKSVAQFARELLEVQAIRETQPGIAFPKDTQWQEEFEASFPYEETTDQISINEIIKRDMGSPHPMDRLICGDVGYGKTELAMRAAFKAATAGYQVIVLVPTTILAQQHYQTFTERMADYPVKTEMISRFRTKAEQAKILQELKEGTIDIIIGTHRLVQPDIKLKKPGLIIIDEEQRFGVEHKEMLKKMKAEIDTLTLTATPIPRTLHMSLLGIRNISTLTTPPLDRRAVVTQIINFDSAIIKAAIKRELIRQGQIYFVHNRIYDIENIADKLKAIVPEAEIEIAHGQLDESYLEERMKKFIEGKTDILVSTNIIESGLDIPRVNTIFINHADNFGLSDLHQLRGRVGRYKHQAYAYLIVPDKSIAHDATKRLKAITEFNELGAGFKIALRDMEIRGTGNILGREQHGHIATIGYDLYCKLLGNAVKIVKATKSDNLARVISDEPKEITVDLRLNSYLPNQYITSEKQRIKIYKRLSKINSYNEINKLKKELIDRFGSPLPEEAGNLLEITGLKVLANNHSFTSLVQTQTEKGETIIVVQYLNYPKAQKLAKRYPNIIHIIDETTLNINISNKDTGKIVSALKEILKEA